MTAFGQVRYDHFPVAAMQFARVRELCRGKDIEVELFDAAGLYLLSLAEILTYSICTALSKARV